MPGNESDRPCPWSCMEFNEAMQCCAPALKDLLRKMALDLNNLRSDVKTMAEKLEARGGDATDTHPKFHGNI